MKKISLLILALFCIFSVHAQKARNLIILIPDGTSIASLSLARLYKSYGQPEKSSLNVDPYICGLVSNHCSNSPFADSAPAMSWYMTGIPSQTAFLSMYPPKDKNDIFPIDAAQAYSPLITIMEGARIAMNKSLGLVFTCEFPHATPAATSSHWYNRRAYDVISDQMVHNSVDVVIGGGAGLLSGNQRNYLTSEGYSVTTDDIEGFRKSQGPKLWSLFGEAAMPNDFDRDKSKYPSLAEMTVKAIGALMQDKDGFVLMVEGSKVDWAAHRNDPVGIISEVLAFDEAVKVALEFAEENGETVVVIMPDHGNSGISIGNSYSSNIYDKLSLNDVMATLAKAQRSAEGIAVELLGKQKEDISGMIKEYWQIDPSVAEINLIDRALKNYINSRSDDDMDAYVDVLAKVIQSRSYVGFTTSGHTAEDVFLAVYTPSGETPHGLLSARQLNEYMCTSIGLESGQLDSLTDSHYCKHTELFKGAAYTFSSDPKSLTVKNGKTTIRCEANTNIVTVNGKQHKTKTPAIYVDKNDTWYISKEILEMI